MLRQFSWIVIFNVGVERHDEEASGLEGRVLVVCGGRLGC